jgi:hypothetical protein
MFLGVERGQCVCLATSPPSVSPQSRQCGSLEDLELYGPPLSVTGIALLLKKKKKKRQHYLKIGGVVGASPVELPVIALHSVKYCAACHVQ